jgi:hypothetical protein
MPICAYGKSRKVKVGPTVEETNVKTVEVSLSSPETSTTRQKDQKTKTVSGGEPTLVRSVKLFWIYA